MVPGMERLSLEVGSYRFPAVAQGEEEDVGEDDAGSGGDVEVPGKEDPEGGGEESPAEGEDEHLAKTAADELGSGRRDHDEGTEQERP